MKQATHDLSINPNDILKETELKNESLRSGGNDSKAAPGFYNNDVQTMININWRQDIVREDKNRASPFFEIEHEQLAQSMKETFNRDGPTIENTPTPDNTISFINS